MDEQLHALAPPHLPFYITGPGQTDVLLNVMIVVVILMFLLLGVFYFKLHALPEQLAHNNPNKMQFEIVAVLALIALFTHNTAFWFAALILAMIRFPDYQSPLDTLAAGMTRLVNRQAGEPVPPLPPPAVALPPSPPVDTRSDTPPRDGEV